MYIYIYILIHFIHSTDLMMQLSGKVMQSWQTAIPGRLVFIYKSVIRAFWIVGYETLHPTCWLQCYGESSIITSIRQGIQNISKYLRKVTILQLV